MFCFQIILTLMNFVWLFVMMSVFYGPEVSVERRVMAVDSSAVINKILVDSEDLFVSDLLSEQR